MLQPLLCFKKELRCMVSMVVFLERKENFDSRTFHGQKLRHMTFQRRKIYGKIRQEGMMK